MLTVPAEKLGDYIDQPLGPSEWVTLDQDRINSFADVTLDHQFIHVDEEKAKATPFGTTIAHGYLSMSLISRFLGECGIAHNMPAHWLSQLASLFARPKLCLMASE